MRQVENIRKQSLNDRFTISEKIAHAEFKKGLNASEIKNNPSFAHYKINYNPYNQKNKYSMPRDRRHSNNLPVKNDSVSPQTYDTLTGQGYVDVKNLQLLEKLSQRSMKKSPSMQGSQSILELNSKLQESPSIQKLHRDMSNVTNTMPTASFKSPSKKSLALSPSGKIDPNNLGHLIHSPTIDIYKTTYNIKGGKFPQTTRKNMQF